MTSLTSITPSRLWGALLVVAVLAFAACATGAVDCAVGKPVGLSAALGAALISLFDTPRAPEPVEATSRDERGEG
ncbi:MAG: hypothetical protein M0R73_01210 [Dehalococcoidia bacterium]|nr:hypothetical protein [Dehalococcoidia bacterium]